MAGVQLNSVFIFHLARLWVNLEFLSRTSTSYGTLICELTVPPRNSSFLKMCSWRHLKIKSYQKLKRVHVFQNSCKGIDYQKGSIWAFCCRRSLLQPFQNATLVVSWCGPFHLPEIRVGDLERTWRSLAYPTPCPWFFLHGCCSVKENHSLVSFTQVTGFWFVLLFHKVTLSGAPDTPTKESLTVSTL